VNKQSQFAPAGWADGSLPGPIVRNKANLLTPGGPRPGGRGTGVLYKQTQFQGRGPGPLPRPSGLAPARPIVRNKPNSDRGRVRGKSCTSKELWWIMHAEDFGRTNPIPGTTGWDEAAGPWDARRTCETKPNLGKTGNLGDGASIEPVVPNKANSPQRQDGRVHGGMCETKPIFVPGQRDGSNKPPLPAAPARRDCGRNR
jgi:hypothetical protein